jgi:hypothetical protein
MGGSESCVRLWLTRADAAPPESWVPTTLIGQRTSIFPRRRDSIPSASSRLNSSTTVLQSQLPHLSLIPPPQCLNQCALFSQLALFKPANSLRSHKSTSSVHSPSGPKTVSAQHANSKTSSKRALTRPSSPPPPQQVPPHPPLTRELSSRTRMRCTVSSTTGTQ